eukprot:607545-Lingulodinium_polyedra.AAC.1
MARRACECSFVKFDVNDGAKARSRARRSVRAFERALFCPGVARLARARALTQRACATCVFSTARWAPRNSFAPLRASAPIYACVSVWTCVEVR